jgi:hypothetical protein
VPRRCLPVRVKQRPARAPLRLGQCITPKALAPAGMGQRITLKALAPAGITPKALAPAGITPNALAPCQGAASPQGSKQRPARAPLRLGADSPIGLSWRPARGSRREHVRFAHFGALSPRRGWHSDARSARRYRRLPLASVIYKVYQPRPRAPPIPLAAPRVNLTHPRLAHSGALSPRRGWHSDARSARTYRH